MSQLWGIPPLSIPIKSLPGQPPELANGWGHVSMSHCSDALLISWSENKIGVDIERLDRKFSAQKIANRYYSKAEQESLKNLNGAPLQQAILKQWIKKEASIKWQKGSIKDDLKKWEILSNSNILIHQILDYKVHINYLNYESWIIAIASDYKKINKDIMLCRYY